LDQIAGWIGFQAISENEEFRHLFAAAAVPRKDFTKRPAKLAVLAG